MSIEVGLTYPNNEKKTASKAFRSVKSTFLVFKLQENKNNYSSGMYGYRY